MDRRRFVGGVAGGASILLAGCTSGGSEGDDSPSGNDPSGGDEQDAWTADDLPSAVDEDGAVDWDAVIDATSAAMLHDSSEANYRWNLDGSSEEHRRVRTDREARKFYYEIVDGSGPFEVYVHGDEGHSLVDGSYSEGGGTGLWDFDDTVERIGVQQLDGMLAGLDGYDLSIDAVTEDRVHLAIDGGAFPQMTVAEGTITLAGDGRLVSHDATGDSGGFESYDVELGPVSVPRPDWVDEHA